MIQTGRRGAASRRDAGRWGIADSAGFADRDVVASPIMDAALRLSIRAALDAERARLLAELGEEIEPPGQMTYGSQAAAATQVTEQQRDLALRGHAAQHLNAVESAISRLEQGTFGLCRRCAQPIPDERLEAIPWAAFCVACQRLVDQGRG